MDYDAILEQVVALLQRQRRLSYRVLKLRLQLDDDTLEALKEDLIYAKQVAVDEEGKVLVWAGGAGAVTINSSGATPSVEPSDTTSGKDLLAGPPSQAPRTPDAERRQLTVLFCDLVDSTALSSRLDPEDWREVVRAYQETCAKVIARYEGHIAQYLGDGLLVYFGYPQAHEDDAQRAVRAGLGMVEAMGQLNASMLQEHRVQLDVRLGIHTGQVVVGEIGGGEKHEQLALGETPNVAARLQGLAAPNTVVISTATSQLLGGFFACQSLGTPPLKGVAQPLEVYQVLSESMARSRLEAAGGASLTPLVGRESEVALLRERWAQVKDGIGQVVLLSGEAGIGKSRLAQVLTEHVAAEPQAWLTPCQCSPYYHNTALYPMIDLLERVVLRFEREESSQQKLNKLEGFLVQYGLTLAEAVPLFASLLSLPLGADYAPLTVSPEQQKQLTLNALLAILLRIAAQQPVLFVMEDLHWVDPSTLELLTLLVDQGPTARILTLLTCRPDFTPPWTGRAHLTQVTLPRLPHRQAAEMTGRVAHGKALPPEVVDQVVAKTDGVPLFVEELTKMVLESGMLQEQEDRYALTRPLPPLAIPATLHDSLMARLDRLATVKGLAQLAATLGREFSYEVLQAVSPWEEGTIQWGLQQLVEAEFLYQRGVPPQATYVFKHALIQDAAYQSLLKSTRQRYHQRTAQVLEAQFPETVETQPELLAHHYTEAGLGAPAVPYWQTAGQRAAQRSAHQEAVGHLTKGMAVLQTLPDTPERTHQDLRLHVALGVSLMAVKGRAAPDVERVYTRALALCQQVGDTPQLFPVLRGLFLFYLNRGSRQRAQELAEQLLHQAERQPEVAPRMLGHYLLGQALFSRGALGEAVQHFQQAIAAYHPEEHRQLAHVYGIDLGVITRSLGALVLWLLGYPDRALAQSQEAWTLAQEVAHPLSQVLAQVWLACLHQFRREAQATHDWAAGSIALAAQQGFSALYVAWATVPHGWALTRQGQWAAGVAKLQEGSQAAVAAGSELWRPYFLALRGEAAGVAGQPEEGRRLLAEAQEVMARTDERFYEAELSRLTGVLHPAHSPAAQEEAEGYMRQALEVARSQQARSWELRAAISLARLWQQQGKRAEAHALLAPIYDWFTEGLDTADLQEAKALLAVLS
jgi:TOMM system kinase/cyclase fusion protein